MRMVLSYVKIFCAYHRRPLAARHAKAAFKQFTKSHNTNNARKVRASFDLLFLSWLLNLKPGEGTTPPIEGGIKALLSNQPWNFPADVIEDTLKGLDGIFEARKEVVDGLNAKDFRDALHKDMVRLVASEKCATVRIPPPLHTVWNGSNHTVFQCLDRTTGTWPQHSFPAPDIDGLHRIAGNQSSADYFRGDFAD